MIPVLEVVQDAVKDYLNYLPYKINTHQSIFVGD